MKAKKILFNLLKDRVGGCKACRLHESRQNVVFGQGSLDARLMIVGEGPGSDEDASGEPFVGKAGKKLDQILKYYKINRNKDVFITNTVCCRPPENRNPLYNEEIVPCGHRLACQIAIIRPTVILGLGSISAQALLGHDFCKEAGSLSSLFNTMHMVDVDDQEFPVIVSYHPSYLLRKSKDELVKQKCKNHWDRVVAFLDV